MRARAACGERLKGALRGMIVQSVRDQYSKAITRFGIGVDGVVRRTHPLRIDSDETAIGPLHRIARVARRLSVPVRIFAGSDDAIVNPESQSGRLFKDVGQSVLSVIPGRGHMVHYDDTERIGDAVEAMALP